MNKQKKVEEMLKKQRTKGITLIALVVTIVVLLILAGITITSVFGEGGILRRAQTAKDVAAKEDIIERAKTDILGKQIENNGSLSEEELTEILTSTNYNTQGTLSDNGEESILDKTLTSKDGKYQILVREIYNGNLTTGVVGVTITYCGDEYTIQRGVKITDWLDSQNIDYYVNENSNSIVRGGGGVVLSDLNSPDPQYGVSVLDANYVLMGGENFNWIPQ